MRQILLTIFKGNSDRTLRFITRISLLASSNYQIAVYKFRKLTQFFISLFMYCFMFVTSINFHYSDSFIFSIFFSWTKSDHVMKPFEG